ncbi:MAG TPA: ABC transporter permease [Polyangiaceae bacterium]|jgi:ribose transport system permease protein|nr:ABC transporter permease [Polyangiaceae bacterium]
MNIRATLNDLLRRKSPRSRGSRPPWVGPLAALLAVYAIFMVLSPSTFGRTQNLVTMARQTVVVGIAASGMTLVIIAGGIDLSVGSMVALTTVLVASILKSGSGAAAAAALAVLATAALGTATGLLVASLKIRPFIVTLGAMTILRGAAKGLAREQKIDVDPRGLDTLLAALPPDRAFLLFPPGVWAMLAVTLLTAGLLNYTRIGLHIFAIGSNEPTAVLAGVAVKRVKVFVYAFAAALAGVAGVLEFSTLTVGDPTDSIGLELEVIASVVIGGASLSGGEGSVFGSLIGACLMTVIKTGCTHMGLPNWVQELVTGTIIIVAVMLDRLRTRRS